MIITKVRLENFGRHKHREFSCNASVVGLLGRNGCGKSTFLQAIEYAITGMLRDKAETYIRHGAKRAVVEVEFIKNGQVGIVTRKITPSTATRDLVWQGKTYNKAGDVDGIMADVLGADRQAVSNAVFLEQGSLDKILFSSQAEREQLFTRMLNVSFLEKTCGVLDGKIKALGAGIEDLTVVFDEVAAQTKAAETDMHRLNGEFSALPDLQRHIDGLSGVISNLEALKTTREKLDTNQVAQLTIRRQMDEVVRTSGFEDIAVVEAKLLILEGGRETLTAEERRLRKLEVDRANWDQTTREINRLSAELTNATLTAENLRAQNLPSSASVNEDLRKAMSLQTAKAQLKNYQDQMQMVTAQLAVHSNTSRPTDNPETYAATITTCNERLADIRQEKAVLDAVLGVHSGTKECCPLCRQRIDPKLLDRARLSELTQLETDIRKQRDVASAKRLEAERAVKEWDATKERLTYEMTQVYAQIVRFNREVEAISVTQEVDHLRALLQQATAAETQLNQLALQTDRLRKELGDAEQRKMALTNQEQALLSFNPEQIAAVTSALQQNQNERTAVSNVLKTVSDSGAHLNRLQGEFESLRRTEEGLLKVLVVTADPNVTTNDIPNLKQQLADLTGKQALRQQAQGRATQARQQYEGLRNKLIEIEARRARNASRQTVVQELSRIREVFGRGNLPMAYVTYQFQRLAIMTQEVLNEMGAPFTIEVDPETPITFKFTRLDDPEAVPMDMGKLSGGQRVRLSIAFLVAVQRLIIPEVGLLILDEPTTHLDSEAVDSVKDLLMSLSTILENTNSQVWVVDHNPSIQAALGAHVNLES